MKSINKGNYFLHYSLLKEASESWIIRKQETNAGIFIMHLFASKRNTNSTINTCDKTIQKLSQSGYRLAFSPALFDFIDEKSLKNFEELDDDEYSLKVASREATNPNSIFFIVSDNKKDEIIRIANEKGYKSIQILSPIDFDLK